eukprot:356345-Chlamydomonas_euryale.AAC.4
MHPGRPECTMPDFVEQSRSLSDCLVCLATIGRSLAGRSPECGRTDGADLNTGMLTLQQPSRCALMLHECKRTMGANSSAVPVRLLRRRRRRYCDGCGAAVATAPARLLPPRIRTAIPRSSTLPSHFCYMRLSPWAGHKRTLAYRRW